MLLFQNMLEGNFQGMMDEEVLTEEMLQEFIEKGYIECKKSFFGRKKFSLTQKGKDYLDNKLLDKIKYIQ